MTESERERETLRGEEVELSGESKQGGREEGRPFWTVGEELTLTLTHTCESNCYCGKSVRDRGRSLPGEADMAATTLIEERGDG